MTTLVGLHAVTLLLFLSQDGGFVVAEIRRRSAEELLNPDSADCTVIIQLTLIWTGCLSR